MKRLIDVLLFLLSKNAVSVSQFTDMVQTMWLIGIMQNDSLWKILYDDAK